MTDTNIRDIIGQLKAWFPPEDHKERDLPGGNKWFYIPWQTIRERFDEVCPEWEVSYSAPVYLGDYCTITCTITIAGISKQGVGNAEIMLLSSSGKNMARGSAIERATADAFKNAGEAWGAARYLDEQTDPKQKAAFIRFMQGKGDGRAADFYHRNEGTLPPKSDSHKQSKPFGGGTPKLATTAPTLTLAPEPQPTNLVRSPNQLRLSKIKEMSGQEWKWIKERGITLNFPADSALLSSEQVDRLRDECFVQWALKVRPELWKHEQHCRNSYVKTLTSLSTSTSDEKVWEEWAGKVFSKDADAVTEKAF